MKPSQEVIDFAKGLVKWMSNDHMLREWIEACEQHVQDEGRRLATHPIVGPNHWVPFANLESYRDEQIIAAAEGRRSLP